MLLAGGAARAQHDDHQLGEVECQVSYSASAQEHVESGVAQLHHMMYEQARPHFERAAAWTGLS